MDGTMQYCRDLGVDPEDVVFLALACFTKAPTMGRFTRRSWVEAWQSVGSVHPAHEARPTGRLADELILPAGATRSSARSSTSSSFGTRCATRLASSASTTLRSTTPRPKGRRACVRRADRAPRATRAAVLRTRADGPLSCAEFEIARELWTLLIPLDPNSTFPAKHLSLWLTFLEAKGGRAVSRDTWSLVRASLSLPLSLSLSRSLRSRCLALAHTFLTVSPARSS